MLAAFEVEWVSTPWGCGLIFSSKNQMGKTKSKGKILENKQHKQDIGPKNTTKQLLLNPSARRVHLGCKFIFFTLIVLYHYSCSERSKYPKRLNGALEGEKMEKNKNKHNIYNHRYKSHQ